MIYYDSTKMGTAKHRSGLMRLSSRLREEMGGAVTPVKWDPKRRKFLTGDGQNKSVSFAPHDWLFTVELFSETERPGFRDFIKNRPCQLAAMFHDAIPVRFPQITWPRSVQRHPEYMKLLAEFDRTWAISEATRQDFARFWHWLGVTPRRTTEVIALGADFDRSQRSQKEPQVSNQRPVLLCVGIVEPRKNQSFLLDVAEALWRVELDFDLHVVGRVNPHFGQPIVARMRDLQRREPRFHFHLAVGDRELGQLYADARVVVFPTIAEGCGLPMLEALWRGVPCLYSDLPVLRENAAGGGGLAARVNDLDDWSARLRTILTDEAEYQRLQAEAAARALPRWADTARILLEALR